jgi:hemerythrin superfamily protein
MVWLPGDTCEDIRFITAAGMEYAMSSRAVGRLGPAFIDWGKRLGPSARRQVGHLRHTLALWWKEQTMPNAIDLLKADHTHVKALFQQYDAAGKRAYQKKQGIAEEVFTELEVHTTLEEELFYSAMKRNTDQDSKDLVAEAIEEHHVVTMLMEELQGLDPKDERYDAKFKVLMENVEHHIEEEEGEMFPEAEEVLGERLERLGTQMQERKQQLIASMK